jgi:hypothetical protein
MNTKFMWKFAAIVSLPLSLVQVICSIPWAQMIPIVALTAILLCVMHERKYPTK